MLGRRAATGRLGALLVVACLGLARGVKAQDSTTAKAIVLPPVETHAFLEIYYRTGDPLVKDGYRLRKADLKFSGFVSPRLRWRVTFDAGKPIQLNQTNAKGADSLALASVSVDQRSRILQDAALSYTANRYLMIDVGQQIIPLSYEGMTPTWLIETIERTNFVVERSRAVGLGDVRDIGVSANGRRFGLEYHAGMYNEVGDSQGTTDPNDQKAVIGRLVYHIPVIPVQLGASGGFEGGPATQEHQRFGTEAQLLTSRVTVRGETMAARDGLLRRFGWYGLAAYRVQKELQLVTRYDWWDRDRTAEHALSNGVQTQIVGGANYFIEGGNAKLAVNVVYQQFPHVSTVRNATFALFALQANF